MRTHLLELHDSGAPARRVNEEHAELIDRLVRKLFRLAEGFLASSVLFTLYCVPWPQLVPLPGRLAGLFLVHGWSWFAMMIPITFWYWLSLRWADRNAAWTTTAREADSS